jgi:hypothetical protein
MTQTHEVPSTMPPQLVPPVGQTTEDQETALKGAFPTVVKGTSAEIPVELRDAYLYALMARSYWEEQVRLVTNQMRIHARNAQTVTVNGVPVAQRRVFPRKEYVVPATEIDAFWPTTRKD